MEKIFYSKIIGGKRYVTSDGQGIRVPLEFDHPEFNHRAGDIVSNPRLALLIADGWEEWTPPTPEPTPQTEPSSDDIARQLLKLQSIGRDIVALDDAAALELKSLFPAWIDTLEKNITLHVGERYYYDERLWKVRQDHTPQFDWKPDEATSLYEEVSVEDGSFDNPISYNNNMELFEGKYYKQDGVKYYCNRSTGTAVYNPLADLVGIYVQVVNE